MKDELLKAKSLITPMRPHMVVEVLSSVSDAGAVLHGEFAEVDADAKIVGQYLGICKIVKLHEPGIWDGDDLADGLEVGDLALIWDTAIRPFDLPSPLGSISLAKVADVFAVVKAKNASEFLSVLPNSTPSE